MRFQVGDELVWKPNDDPKSWTKWRLIEVPMPLSEAQTYNMNSDIVFRYKARGVVMISSGERGEYDLWFEDEDIENTHWEYIDEFKSWVNSCQAEAKA